MPRVRSAAAPGAGLEINDLGVRADASGLHQPLVHGGDVAACGIDAAGEVDGVVAAGLGGSTMGGKTLARGMGRGCTERRAGLAPAFPRRKRDVFPWTTNALPTGTTSADPAVHMPQ